MIKYAVIGRGKIAEQYIEGANLSGRFELAAIYSRTKETGMEFAKKYSVTKVYTQLQEMIEDGMRDLCEGNRSIFLTCLLQPGR